MNNTYTATTFTVHPNAPPARKDTVRVVTPKGPHTVTISSTEWHTKGLSLVSFLAEHIGVGYYKLRFAKNAKGQVLEGNPVDIEFLNQERYVWFKMSCDLI